MMFMQLYGRCVDSYTTSIALYRARTQSLAQPSAIIPLLDLNLFNVDDQNNFLILFNTMYIIITFMIFVIMKNRSKGLNLRYILLFYDAINVILVSYVAFSTFNYKVYHNPTLICNELTSDLEGYKIAQIFLLFYVQKYFEFFDTWFFILRKSSRQVTFLHLFHHSSITIVVGSILPFDYNGDMYLPIMLNSANHMLIYLHYLLATLGMQSWWAPHITTLQLLQFCAIFGQSVYSYSIGPQCGSPDFAKVLMIVYMGSMIALFGHFFLQRYILGKHLSGVDSFSFGVFKSPSTVSQTHPNCAQQPNEPLLGTLQLTSHGKGEVILPHHDLNRNVFWKEKIASLKLPEGPDRSEGSCQPSIAVSYHLTAIGKPMPNLHVSQELHVRHREEGVPFPSNFNRSDDGLSNLLQTGSREHLDTGATSTRRPKKHKEVDATIGSQSFETVLVDLDSFQMMDHMDEHDEHRIINRSPNESVTSYLNHGHGRGKRKTKPRNEVPDPAHNPPSSSSSSHPSDRSNQNSFPKSASFNDFLRISEQQRQQHTARQQVINPHDDRLIDGPLSSIITGTAHALMDTYSKHMKTFTSSGSMLLFIDQQDSTSSISDVSSSYSSMCCLQDDIVSSSKVRNTNSSHQKENFDDSSQPRNPVVSSSSSGAVSNVRDGPTQFVISNVELELTIANTGEGHNHKKGKHHNQRTMMDNSMEALFVVDGGAPGGQISWMISLLPRHSHIEKEEITAKFTIWVFGWIMYSKAIKYLFADGILNCFDLFTKQSKTSLINSTEDKLTPAGQSSHKKNSNNLRNNQVILDDWRAIQ